MFNESISPFWNINFQYLDKNLIKIVSPHINPDSSLVFENINWLRKEDIPILDVILSDLSVDVYSKSQRYVSIFIRSYNMYSNSKYKLSNIKNLYKFIDKFSKNFIREELGISIENWILEESDLFYLWRK